ncbi:MAG: hypothetical protein M4579_000187 [Chaenotheca gracillima]|nr:MAG: hypothetical protein M4579_000187 [Chaenotheca gracillima]
MTGSNETRPLRFPLHNEPRVWLLTTGTSPLSLELTRQLHSHGDFIAIAVGAEEYENSGGRIEDLKSLLAELGDDARTRIKILNVDLRSAGQCQAAVAETIKAWGKIDILLSCTSEAVVGAVEELSTSPETLALVRDQFETNFFGPVNIIKAALPVYRAQRTGHILVLTGITGHIGTPGLGMYCASSWALEGFCDSLAYEVAPFNVKMTIVQPNMEVNVLTNKMTFTPPMPEYASENNPAPSIREIFSNIIATGFQNGSDGGDDSGSKPQKSNSSSPVASRNKGSSSDKKSTSLYPALSQAAKLALVSETVHALIAVGGHENPPARHIVGHEGVASVKEKLKTVSEELEDFVEVSGAVDIFKDENDLQGDANGGAGPNANG